MSEKNNTNWLFISLALVVGIIIGGGATYLLKSGSGSSGKAGSVNVYPSKANGSEWLVKIDDYVITKPEFEDGLRYFMAQIPEQQRANLPNEAYIKKQYLDSLIGQYVIVLKAANDGSLNTKESQFIMSAAVRQAIYNFYLQKFIPQDKSAFIPSQAEINQYYNQNKAQFDRMGASADQIKQYAINDLGQRKLQLWVSDFIEQAKESYKIQRNTDVLQKEGITASPAPGGAMTGPAPAGK